MIDGRFVCILNQTYLYNIFVFEWSPFTNFIWCPALEFTEIFIGKKYQISYETTTHNNKLIVWLLGNVDVIRGHILYDLINVSHSQLNIYFDYLFIIYNWTIKGHCQFLIYYIIFRKDNAISSLNSLAPTVCRRPSTITLFLGNNYWHSLTPELNNSHKQSIVISDLIWYKKWLMFTSQ